MSRRRRLVKRIAIATGLSLVAAVAFFFIMGARLRSRFLTTPRAPGSATGLRAIDPVVAEKHIVVAAHPEAARVGDTILAGGGSAIDAAIAMQLALTLVEPDASGIGGGAFLLYWDAKTKKLHAYDGRETAPAAATPELFMQDGSTMSFPAALVGGRAVGVPGVLRMLEMAHERHGALAWAKLFDEPIAMAERGFAVTNRLERLLALDPVLVTVPSTKSYFYGGGVAAPKAGTVLKNAPLAATFRALQKGGANAFYEGPIAKRIVAAVQSAKRPSMGRSLRNLIAVELGMDRGGAADTPNPGSMTEADLAGYEAVEREPLCRTYRKVRVCGFPPPTSGGVAVLEILGLLERFDPKLLDPKSATAMHLLAEAEQLAYADRDKFVADPDFVDVPVEGLLDAKYLEARSAKIREHEIYGKPKPGKPPGAPTGLANAPAVELPSTSHMVVVDSAGNIACMTTSIEFSFGAHLMVDGFLLNNQLTDFSFKPKGKDGAIANAPGPKKRPRSSMSPMIVFDAQGTPILALGSPGGSRIIAYVAQTLLAVVDGGLTPQEAVNLPRVIGKDGKTEIEDVGWASDEARTARLQDLSGRGHKASAHRLESGLSVVGIAPGKLSAGVDPRRDGAAAGR